MNIADINSEARDLCDADTTSYPAAALLRRVNAALETLIGKIINAYGTWQFDDTNFTDSPVGVGTLIEGQSPYSFAVEYLTIENIKVKDASGYWHLLEPIDQSRLNYPLEDDLSADGLPTHYDKVGDTINLYPAPTATSVTLASGLKIQFTRTGSLFTAAQVTTGTKVPGIASPWHITIAKMAALPYCKTYKKDRVAQLHVDIREEIEDMVEFYTSREKDVRTIIKTKKRVYK